MRDINLTDINKLKASFKEGVYTDGFTICTIVWSYEKEVLNIGDDIAHSSVYPIVWLKYVSRHFVYLGVL